VLSLEDRKLITPSASLKGRSRSPGNDNQSISYTPQPYKGLLWRRSLSEQKPQLIAELGDDEIEDSRSRLTVELSALCAASGFMMVTDRRAEVAYAVGLCTKRRKYHPRQWVDREILSTRLGLSEA